MAGSAVAVWVTANNPSTTIAANGYNGGSATGDAPAALTTETWTVTSSATFPAASSSATPPTQFAIADVAAPTEIIWVTNMSGTTWTVIRGEEGTTPVTHAAGATFQQVITSAHLAALNPGDGTDFYGNAGSAPSWPLYGAYVYAASGSLKTLNADGLAYEVGEQRLMGTTVTTTGTTTASIPGLAAAVGPGSYFIECWIPYAGGTALQTWTFGFSTSSAPTLTAVDLSALIQNSTVTVTASYLLTTYGNVTSTTLSATMWTSPKMSATSPAEGLVHIWGTVTVSVAGTLQATVTNSTSNDNCTIPAGALMKVSPNN